MSHRLYPLLLLVLVGCAARGPRTDEGPDPRILEADLAWDDRNARGLQPVEDALMAGMRTGRNDREADYLWRHARMLVERGMGEQDQRRAAIDSYAQARGQAFHCMDQLPAWKQRRQEAGVDAALEVVNDKARPCLAWGTLAWARWVALMGGDAAALDIAEIRTLADWLQTNGTEQEQALGRWAGALVVAARPGWMAGDAEKARKRFERVIDDKPNDLIRRWDLATLVGQQHDLAAVVETQFAEIRDRPANTEVDRAVKRWVQEAAKPEPTRDPAPTE